MRVMRLIVQCPESIAGSLLADVSERKGVEIKGVSVVVDLSASERGRKEKRSGLTSREVLTKLVDKRPGGFATRELKAEFESCGLSSKSVNSFITAMHKTGVLKKDSRTKLWIGSGQ